MHALINTSNIYYPHENDRKVTKSKIAFVFKAKSAF